MTKTPKLVRNRKVIRFNKDATYVRALSDIVNDPIFDKGVFISSTKDGNTNIIFRNCTTKDIIYLISTGQHLILNHTVGASHESELD